MVEICIISYFHISWKRTVRCTLFSGNGKSDVSKVTVSAFKVTVSLLKVTVSLLKVTVSALVYQVQCHDACNWFLVAAVHSALLIYKQSVSSIYDSWCYLIGSKCPVPSYVVSTQ